MFGIKFFTEKSVFVDIESKVKPLDYGMVAMSSSWVMNLTRWLVISSVLTATRAAFSPEGKWNLCIRLIFGWALRSIFEATILSKRYEAHTLKKKKYSAFPSSYFINNPIVEEKAKGLPTSRLDENSRRKDFFFSFLSLFPLPTSPPFSSFIIERNDRESFAKNRQLPVVQLKSKTSPIFFYGPFSFYQETQPAFLYRDWTSLVGWFP